MINKWILYDLTRHIKATGSLKEKRKKKKVVNSEGSSASYTLGNIVLYTGFIGSFSRLTFINLISFVAEKRTSILKLA